MVVNHINNMDIGNTDFLVHVVHKFPQNWYTCWMDVLHVLHPFKCISVILVGYEGDYEELCAMNSHICTE